MVVVGAVKLVCETPRGKRVSVCFVAPGQVVPGEWPVDGVPARRDVRAVAHDPLGTVVASWTRRVLLDVLATLPPGQAMHAIATASQAAMELLRQKCDLLGLALRDRVLAVLQGLARDFGRPHPEGVRIELRLTHQDVAGAAVGSRANVTRALEELRADGEVLVDDHRLVVTHRGLVAFRAAAPTRPRLADGWSAAAAAH
jgi:CRP-like cAMP-binding protein